jgi:SAM-dependent methyltransferase
MSVLSSRRLYDLLYRFGAPWESGARAELVELVGSGRLRPCRAIDLGCGSGANALFLGAHRFDVVGVDFSAVAIGKARRRVAGGAEHVRFVRADLTAPSLGEAEGRYDLLVDYSTLDDLTGEARLAMVRTIHRTAAPNAHVLLWCFYGRPQEMPRISFSGPSRITPLIVPGEVEQLFGRDFDIERLPEPRDEAHAACFLMTKTDVDRRQHCGLTGHPVEQCSPQQSRENRHRSGHLGVPSSSSSSQEVTS